MGYATIHDVAIDPDSVLRKQTIVAIRKAALDVRGESDQTSNHAARIQWANQVLTPSGAIAMGAAMIWRVLDNATIQGTPTTSSDDAVQFTVNGLVNEFAGTSA